MIELPNKYLFIVKINLYEREFIIVTAWSGRYLKNVQRRWKLFILATIVNYSFVFLQN